jgi:hypothetical protein
MAQDIPQFLGLMAIHLDRGRYEREHGFISSNLVA